MTMTDDANNSPSIIEAVLIELVSDAEALLVLANALENQAPRISSHASPRELRRAAALMKGAAIQIALAVAGLLGSAERLRAMAERESG